jgi:hypothetical protein
MPGRYLEDAWRMPGGCLEDAWRILGNGGKGKRRKDMYLNTS